MIRAEGESLGDEDVISLVLDGEVEAFALLVRRHKARVFRLGLSFFRDADEAEDFVQDVFVKAYTALAGFRGRSSFSTWLLRIAYNDAVNRKTRAKETLSLDVDAELDRGPGLEERHMAAETARVVREAVSELPPRQARCVELFFYQDLTYAEISEITGFPVNTIKSHVFRAKRALRERLGAEKEVLDAL